MGKDVSKWSRSCIACQLTKIHTHIKTPFEQLPAPTKRFSHIHVDLVGPLTSCEGKNMLFTVIDRWRLSHCHQRVRQLLLRRVQNLL